MSLFMVDYIKIRNSYKWRPSRNSWWIFITFFRLMNWAHCSCSCMNSKVHPFGFPKCPCLRHSVQMAGTGDFQRKMSEISPVGVSFVSELFSLFFVFFAMCPPAIRWLPENGVSYSLCGFRTTGGGSIRPNGRSRGAEQVTFANCRLALYPPLLSEQNSKREI